MAFKYSLACYQYLILLFFMSSNIVQGCWASKTISSTTTTPNLSSISNSIFKQTSTGSGVSIDEVYQDGRILEVPNLRIFTFAELKSATRNFKPGTILGEGGFGRVYKGWFDEKTPNPSRSLAGMVVAAKKLNPEKTPNPSKSLAGMVVAVKKLNPESMQGLEQWLVIA